MNKPNTSTSTKREVENITITDLEVLRARVFKGGTVSFDMKVNGISIYGCIVHESSSGDWFSLPQRKGTDGKYYSICWAKFSDADTKLILAEVERKLNQ